MDDQRQPPAGASSARVTQQPIDAEADQLIQQAQSGDFSGMRQYLAHTRQARDWQDRFFILNLIAPFIPVDALLDASASEPDAADLLFLLGAYYYHMSGQSRGTRVAEQTSEEQFDGAHQQLQNMMMYLLRVYQLDPDDPTPHVFAVRGLVVFGQYENTLKQEYAEAVRLAPDLVPAHSVMVNARSKKWGGSHEESLHIARAAVKAGKSGNDLPACLFSAHFLVWQYSRLFDKNKIEADQYIKSKPVVRELNEALDHWLDGSHRRGRSSVQYLHQAALWYYLSSDYVRLQRVLSYTEGVSHDDVWSQIGSPAKTYGDALQKAASAQPKKPGFLGLFKR